MMDRRLRSESARSSFPASPEVSRPWLFQRGDYASHMNLLMMSNYRGFLGDCMILHFLATYTEYTNIYIYIYIYTAMYVLYVYKHIHVYSISNVYPMYHLRSRLVARKNPRFLGWPMKPRRKFRRRSSEARLPYARGWVGRLVSTVMGDPKNGWFTIGE